MYMFSIITYILSAVMVVHFTQFNFIQVFEKCIKMHH